jgi:hypothetical protein
MITKYNTYGEVKDEDEYNMLIMLCLVDSDIQSKHIFCDKCDMLIRKSMYKIHKMSSPNCLLHPKLKRKPNNTKTKMEKDNIKMIVSFS